MSGKLDQSLDEILSTTKASRGRGRNVRGRRAPAAGRTAATAPQGGIKKNTKAAKPVGKVPTGPSATGPGKIQVSGLPKDANEAMIKTYFTTLVKGVVKRVEISYGKAGEHRGIATVTFARSELAVQAAQEANGLLVDGRPMKVDLIIDATSAASIPAPKGLSERIQAKNQPKTAAPKKKEGGAATRGGKAARGGRGGKSARPAKKTAEELDSEMADYFEGGANNNANGGETAAAVGGDAAMDEIL